MRRYSSLVPRPNALQLRVDYITATLAKGLESLAYNVFVNVADEYLSSPTLSPPAHLPIAFPSSPSQSSPSHHCPLLLTTVPSYPPLSPPFHHCPLLPVTVPSSRSLSPPSCHCPLLLITVPSSPSLSLLLITVPFFPSLSPSFPSHHVIMADCFSPTTVLQVGYTIVYTLRIC